MWRRFLALCVLCAAVVGLAGVPGGGRVGAGPRSYRQYFPQVYRHPQPTLTPVPTATPDPCRAATGESYALIPLEHTSLDPSVHPSQHPDLNLAVRGYQEVVGPSLGLVDYGGDTHAATPRLQTLFADQTWRGVPHVYRVGDWNGQWPPVITSPITAWPVTLMGLNSHTAETVHVPYRTGDIYQSVYVAIVLYADPNRITLQYTRNDYVPGGYTVHIEGICVDPNLLQVYAQVAGPGRGSLPGIRYGQALGRAAGPEVKVAICDNGSFMDPRSRKDWW
jgi:hypothetical protein